MPGESANSIGHYLASRGASSDISSNLTLSKPATKPSNFSSSINDTSTTTKSSAFSSSFNATTKKSSTFSNEISSSTPIAKPRSVYNETKQEPTRSSPPRSYPVATKNNFDSSEVNIVSHPIVTVGNGGEDWGTKKRVETKTVKTIETRRQRQLVLEDGRIIEEDEPEVTVDTIEDVESHSDDGEEDRHIIGGYGDSYNASRALQTTSPVNGNGEVTPWKPGGNILGEDLRRNTYTTDVQKRSYSTTSAKNVGEIKKSDLNKIIKEGRHSKTFIRPYDDTDSSENVTLAPKVTHKNSNRKRIVDREDIQEVHRMQDGVVKTDRYVNRECVEDQGEETPDEGDSTETESHDGDKDSFSQRREDKFIDYYRVPKGKTVKDGKLVRHGIHLSSHDKSNAKGGAINDTTMRPAITYRSDDQSDSTATPPREVWGSSNKKPPKPDRRQSSARKNENYRRSMRYSSSERERESTRSPNHEDYPPHYSTPSTGLSSANKFHTIERSSHVGRSRKTSDKVFYGSSNIGTGTDQRKPVAHPPNSNTIHRGSRGRSSDHFSDDMNSSYRSRSMSRSNQGTRSVDPDSNKASNSKFDENIRSHPHHRSMGTIRKDLDNERSGRLKRAMSFSTHERRPVGKKKAPSEANSDLNGPSSKGNNRSFLGSMKSLYSSLRRGSVQNQKKEKENRITAANKAWFDDGTDQEPIAPPRKTRSQVSSLSGGKATGSYQKSNRAYSHSSTNIASTPRANSKIHTSNTIGRQRQKSPPKSSKSFETTGNRQWDIYSSKTNREKSPSRPIIKHNDNLDANISNTVEPAPTKTQTRQKSPMSFLSGKLGGSLRGNKSNHNTANDSDIADSAATMARERQRSNVDRRRTQSTYETSRNSENRDPPRFEEERQRRQRGQVRSRFFGQRDEDDSEAMDPEADDLRRNARPAPDMRRLLLNNINMSRSKSIGNDLDQKHQPSVIRAI